MKKIIVTLLLLIFHFYSNAQLKYIGSVTGNSVGETKVTKNGKFLISLQFHDLIVYAINPTTGELTKKKTFPNPEDQEFTYSNLSPDDQFLYVRTHSKVNGKLMTVFKVYKINWTTFEFKPIQTISNQDGKEFEFNAQLKISPKGSFLLASSENGTELYVYRRNKETGMLTFASKKVVPQSQFSEFDMSSDERFLYGASFNLFKAFVVYQMDQSGNMSEIQQIEHPSFKHYTSDKFVITPNNKYIYAIGTDSYASDQDQSHITIYERNSSTGMLTYKSHYANLKNEGIRNISFIHIDGSGETFYALSSLGNDFHGIYVFKANPIDGSLTKVQTISDAGTTSKLRGVYEVSYSPNNKIVYFSAARGNAITIMQNPNAKASYVFTEVAPIETMEQTEIEENVLEEEPVETVETVETSNPSGTTSNTAGSTSNSSQSGISKEFYAEIWRKLSAESTDAKKLDICYEQLEGKSMKTVQVAALAMLFSSEYKRLEFVKFMSYFTSDKENYKILVDLFTFETIKDDFKKSIK